MLLLDSRVHEIDGFTVFPDHAGPGWYYQPTMPQLTMLADPETGVLAPQLRLIGWRGATGDGGLLTFDVNVGASQDRIDDLARQLANREHLLTPPPIAPVPLVGGTVRLLALGSASDGGTPAPDGQPFVLRMDHHTAPALFGRNQASFSVRLDAEGFTMAEACLDGEIMPIAVIYSLDYWGLRPAYAMRLSVDWDRVQKHLDQTFSAGLFFLSSEIGKAVDELVDQRAIVLESDTFVPEGTDSSGVIGRRDAALAQLRNMITDNFFTISLPPYQPAQKADWEKALDAVGKLAATTSVIAAGGPGAAGAASMSFSYKRMNYQRMDSKSLNVNFSERTTITRSIHPQAHLAALSRVIGSSGLPRERFVTHVDLDNDWFARRRLKVLYRPGLGATQIASVNVRALYGDRPQNKIMTAPEFQADFEWLSQVRMGVFRRDVQVSYDVQFADVDTTERPGSLTFTEPATVEEELSIRPEENLFAVRPVPVVAENFPWDRYSSVEVHLRYRDDDHHIAQRDLIRLTKDRPDGTWNMFVLDRSKLTFEVRTVFRALDNRDHVVDFVPSDEPQVTVRNPFPSQRVLEVTASAVDWTLVKEAFVDLRYADPAHQVLREESFTFTDGIASQRFVVDLRDPGLIEVSYVVTFVMADHSTITVPESVTRDRRIAIRPDMRGRRVVTVRPPADFAARRLRTVTVDLRFDDLLGGLSFAEQIVFTDGEGEGRFEYDVVDDSRNRFEYHLTTILENGLVRTSDWTASDTTNLRPVLD